MTSHECPSILHVRVCVRVHSYAKNYCPTARRRNPVWTRRSVNPLSPAEKGEGEEGQHTEALTQLIIEDVD